MINYQQMESLFRNEEYQYEIPPEQKGQESWQYKLNRNARDNLNDSSIKSISIDK